MARAGRLPTKIKVGLYLDGIGWFGSDGVTFSGNSRDFTCRPVRDGIRLGEWCLPGWNTIGLMQVKFVQP